MNAIIDCRPYVIPGANGPRSRGWPGCPCAVNGKHTPPFVCRMVAWSPAVRYSVDELVDGLQLDMTPAGRPRTRSAGEHPAEGQPVWIPGSKDNAVLVALRGSGLYKALARRRQARHYVPLGTRTYGRSGRRHRLFRAR